MFYVKVPKVRPHLRLDQGFRQIPMNLLNSPSRGLTRSLGQLVLTLEPYQMIFREASAIRDYFSRRLN
jgi:hypothetical protein